MLDRRRLRTRHYHHLIPPLQRHLLVHVPWKAHIMYGARFASSFRPPRRGLPGGACRAPLFSDNRNRRGLPCGRGSAPDREDCANCASGNSAPSHVAWGAMPSRESKRPRDGGVRGQGVNGHPDKLCARCGRPFSWRKDFPAPVKAPPEQAAKAREKFGWLLE